MVGMPTGAQSTTPLLPLHAFSEGIWQSEQNGEECRLGQTVTNLLRRHQSVLLLGQVSMNKNEVPVYLVWRQIEHMLGTPKILQSSLKVSSCNFHSCLSLNFRDAASAMKLTLPGM